MKLRFEPDLPHQAAAVAAVADLFRGQEIGRTEFTVTRTAAAGAQAAMGLDETALGVGNRLLLTPEAVAHNLREVQLRHGLAPLQGDLQPDGWDFTVEMETGTGKTYVYLSTIFELNRRYGFTKFVIIVPSVAIREGVAKTLEMTAEHFRALYAGAPMDWFVYDGARPGPVRDFATASGIKVMVATITALNKMGNIFWTPTERTDGWRPADLVCATRPIILIDEPQSVEGGEDGAGARALRDMNALCRLRYSATHAQTHNMVYRLDAVDAYEARLVKRVDVAGLEVSEANNKPYVKLLDVKTQKGRLPQAKVELDIQELGGVRRVERVVQDGTPLSALTRRTLYDNVTVGNIEGAKGKSGKARLELNVPGDIVWLQAGEAHGDVPRDAVVRSMIVRTLWEHFEREKLLKPMGIKVLSLFFVDKVANYRVYGDDGSQALGPYGVMFEEEYRRLAKHPDFKEDLFAAGPPDPAQAHGGYFSMDRKNRVKEPELTAAGELKAASRDDAERGFNLIMRHKEKLLDEAEPLRFIFSHSALREGWDNPNVFQICSLRDMAGDRERRQTIGRGLRLCVDKHGDRRRDAGLNVLTVVADESYATFAAGLQTDLEHDLGVKFGMVTCESFANLPVSDESGVVRPLGAVASAALFVHLAEAGFIDANGTILDTLRDALKAGTLVLPAEYAPAVDAIRTRLTRLARRLEVGNAKERKTIPLNKVVLLGADFRALWDRIKTRTTYRVNFDANKLVADAIERLAEAPAMSRPLVRFIKAQMEVSRTGVEGTNVTTSSFQALQPEAAPLPDVLGELQNRTQLTRRSLARILADSGRLDDLRLNPAGFLDQAADLINRAKRAALVAGVSYQSLPDQDAYAQELFGLEEIKGYLGRMIEVQKSVTEAVPYDSEIEQVFAAKLNASEAVRVFAKLPDWFIVPTPLGGYNPDWAVLAQTTEGEKLFFVVETKGTELKEDLRLDERDRIDCGGKHFEALAKAVGDGQPQFRQERSADRLLASLAAPSTGGPAIST